MSPRWYESLRRLSRRRCEMAARPLLIVCSPWSVPSFIIFIQRLRTSCKMMHISYIIVIKCKQPEIIYYLIAYTCRMFVIIKAPAQLVKEPVRMYGMWLLLILYLADVSQCRGGGAAAGAPCAQAPCRALSLAHKYHRLLGYVDW